MQDTRGGGNSKEKIWRITGPSGPAPRKKSVKKANKTAVKKKVATKAGRKNRKGSKIADSFFRKGAR